LELGDKQEPEGNYHKRLVRYMKYAKPCEGDCGHIGGLGPCLDDLEGLLERVRSWVIPA
jgi:hypothetical protein